MALAQSIIQCQKYNKLADKNWGVKAKKEPRETKKEHCDQSQGSPTSKQWIQKESPCVDVFTPPDKHQRPNKSTNCCRGWFAAQSSMHFQDTFSLPLSEAAWIKDYPNELKMQVILTHSGPSHWHPTEEITSLQFTVLVVPGRFITFGRRLWTAQLGGAPGCSWTPFASESSGVAGGCCSWAGKFYRNKITVSVRPFFCL